MEKIYLSDAGPKVSPAIYGFYRWDELGNVPKKMEQIVNLCLELGINTFDHADYYGGYQCETIFGDIIARKSFRREEVVLFSKCGLRIPHPSEPGIRIKHINTSAKRILESIDSSLKKLKTDYLDIFLLNHLDHISNIEETAYVLQRLKETGKVKNIGVSNFSVFQHQLLASYLKFPIVTNHIELNLLNTSAIENGQIDYIKQRYMRPLASAPLAEGRVAQGTDNIAVRVRRKLQEISIQYHVDIESIAVAWLIKLGALPLIGTQIEQRIKNIVRAFDIDLDCEQWYELYTASKGDTEVENIT